MFIADNIGLIFSAAAIAAVSGMSYWAWKRVRRPTRQALLLRIEYLEYSIQNWQYPEGDYVPQHKRLPMMHELHRLSKQLEKYADLQDQEA